MTVSRINFVACPHVSCALILAKGTLRNTQISSLISPCDPHHPAAELLLVFLLQISCKWGCQKGKSLIMLRATDTLLLVWLCATVPLLPDLGAALLFSFGVLKCGLNAMRIPGSSLTWNEPRFFLVQSTLRVFLPCSCWGCSRRFHRFISGIARSEK